ncbi:hypothetical protein FRB97_002866 [Tulasnella sp. 331]|nr:hypothetical protein FRB97_002866 [Tulasnella sp. 331]
MFKFDFTPADLSDDGEGEQNVQSDAFETNIGLGTLRASKPVLNGPHDTGIDENMADAVMDESQKISLDTLLSALPPMISYSTISIPLESSATPLILPRRDLFDVRFQLMASDPDEELAAREPANADTTFLNAPSDLVPGVYEGGFKTWECSVDLTTYIHRIGKDTPNPRSVLELGCGTALPSCCIFRDLLLRDQDEAKAHSTAMYLQDYNKAVLELVTLPNLLLTWFFFNSSKAYRDTQPQDSNVGASSFPDSGEVAITSNLLGAFTTSLETRGITLNFYSGAWSTFDHSLSATCDLVLTSETIYRASSLPSLIAVLKSAPRKSVILVAAKVVYFGVGGGVRLFVEAVLKAGGTVAPVWQMRDGVGRQVLQVSFLSKLPRARTRSTPAMKALLSRFSRSHNKDKDAVNVRVDKGNRLTPTTTTEKSSQPVMGIPSSNFPTSAADSDGPAPPPQSTKTSPDRLSRLHGIHRRDETGGRGSSTWSNQQQQQRPPSQFELSLQKPLPDLSSRPLPQMMEEEPEPVAQERQPLARQSAESSRGAGRRAREPSQSTTTTHNPHDSQGRSTTLSKQSQSTQLTNSLSTDNTSLSGSTTPPVNQPPAGPGGKKVAFISPPPTPGTLPTASPLPDLVTDLNSPTTAERPSLTQSPTSITTATNTRSPTSASHHTQSHSISKASSFPNGTSGPGNALSAGATGSTTNLSLKNVAAPTSGRGSSMSKTAPKPSSSTISPGRAPATSPMAGRALGTHHQGGSAARAAMSGRADFAQSVLSLRSGTPHSHMSGKSAIQMPASWSEAAEEDLVSNLGPRERTRQEVLWEIVASEQRYIAELIKLKESFIDPLLHPYATSPITSTTTVNGTTDPYSIYPDDVIYNRSMSPTDSIDHLPIASRFLSSPTPGSGPGTAASSNKYGKRKAENENGVSGSSAGGGGVAGLISDAASIDSDDVEGEASDKMGKPYMNGLRNMMKRTQSGGSSSNANRKGVSASQASARSPYQAGSRTTDRGQTTTRSNTPYLGGARSHSSLPPPARGGASSRQSLVETNPNSNSNSKNLPTTPPSRKLHKHAPVVDEGMVLPPHLLPEDLRICLEVLEGPTLKGHITLSDSLRKRYDEQYPLVRSLADVFVANSRILEGYATYVLHLERALEQVDNALQPGDSKKKPKNQDAADWAKVCRVFKRLEEIASDKGETGLAISLSKPFQRLLKYPLMFQNLLFHTDPSTFEYESTLQMVAEVERIVRSIEDEKIQKEERDQTRDVFARIEGLEKVKMLAIPKPSRVLVEEKVYFGGDDSTLSGVSSRATSPPSSTLVNGFSSPNAKNVKTKSSLKRLSDVLPGAASRNNAIGGKNDLWLVRFNDVVLMCQRTGMTSLPLVTNGVIPGSAVANSSAGGRANSLPDYGKSKYATTGRRPQQIKPRNLYKFIKIETWVIGTVAKPRAGMVSMEDIGRSRSNVVAIEPVKSGDTDDEDGDSDDSDRKSKMSFSYWGADKITVDPVASAKARAAAVKTSTKKGSPLAPAPYARTESSARAKFGHRLRGADDEDGPSVRSTAPRRGAASTQSAARRLAAATDDSVMSSRRVAAAAARASGVASPTPASVSSARRVHNQSTTSNASAAIAARAKVRSATPSLADSGVGDWVDPSVHRL